MAVLQSTNVQGTLCVNGVAVGGGKDFKYCCFTASTTFTPSQDLVDGDAALDAFQVAGGGGGGGLFHRFCMTAPNNSCCAVVQYIASSGGGGSSTNSLIDITATDACTVTVGAGGTGGNAIEDPAAVCNYNAGLQTAASSGGNSSFGGTTTVGGGGGTTTWLCQCLCQGAFISPKVCFTAGSRNGGSNCMQCSTQFQSPVTSEADFDGYIMGGFTPSGGGGSSYVEDDPVLKWTDENFRCRLSYVNEQTGSGFILNSFDNPNGTLINGTPLGAGGYAPTMGCSYNGYSASYNTDVGGTNEFQNVDLNILNGVITTQGQTYDCQAVNTTWATSSAYPNKYYGAGGKPAGSVLFTVANQGPIRHNMHGGEGNSGIVVLKWYE